MSADFGIPVDNHLEEPPVARTEMTRRLDPMERVDELGDASVPFNFDVHAMIFSDDAPKLEAASHNAFADRKLNL